MLCHHRFTYIHTWPLILVLFGIKWMTEHQAKSNSDNWPYVAGAQSSHNEASEAGTNSSESREEDTIGWHVPGDWRLRTKRTCVYVCGGGCLQVTFCHTLYFICRLSHFFFAWRVDIFFWRPISFKIALEKEGVMESSTHLLVESGSPNLLKQTEAYFIK